MRGESITLRNYNHNGVGKSSAELIDSVDNLNLSNYAGCNGSSLTSPTDDQPLNSHPDQSARLALCTRQSWE